MVILESMSLNRRFGLIFRSALMLIMFLNCFDAFSMQSAEVVQQQIKGVVVDSDNQPLPGVAVLIKGDDTKKRGTQTDFDGLYTIKASKDAVLVFSYMGMKTVEVKLAEVESLTSVDVKMEASAEQIEEMVVVGYGKAKKIDIAGAVSTISAKDIEDTGVTSITDILESRFPGFNIGVSNGSVASDPSFNVRGFGSINSTNPTPLIIVNGFPVDSDILATINPFDIESISILRDGASTAIYGGRAAYGVVLIELKDGVDSPLRFTARTTQTFAEQTYFPEFVDAYTHMITANKALTNAGSSPRFKSDYLAKVKAYRDDPDNNPVDEVVNPVYDDKGKLIGGDYYYYGDVDYMNETFKRLMSTQDYQFAVSGGLGKTSISASMRYLNLEGPYKVGNTDRKQYGATISTTTRVNDWFSFGTRMIYLKKLLDRPYHKHGYSDLWDDVYYQRTYFPLYSRANGYMLNHAPGRLSAGSRNKQNKDDFLIALNLKLEPIKKENERLRITGLFNMNIESQLDKQIRVKKLFQDNFGYRFPVDRLWYPVIRAAGVTERTDQERDYNFELTANYIRTFLEDHTVTATVSYNQMYRRDKTYSMGRDGLISPNVPSFNLTLDQDSGRYTMSESDFALRGLVGRLIYNYKSRYILAGSVRYDGSSRFAKGKRFGTFPSASLVWNVTNEPLYKKLKEAVPFFEVFNRGKLKGSWSQLGNQNAAGRYAYTSTMGKGRTNVLLGGDRANYVSTPGLPNPDVTWETVEGIDAGGELGAFKNRLSVEVNFYIRNTKGMLMPAEPLPSLLGTSAPSANAADLTNRGWEFEASWKDRIGDWKYNVGFILSDSRSFIKKYRNPKELLSTWRVGEQIGEIWGYETEGIFQTKAEADEANSGGSHDQTDISGRAWVPGDIKYKDLNGDGKITDGDNTAGNPGDRKVIGNSSPRYRFNITLGVQYKGFNLRAIFDGVGKRDLWLDSSMFFPMTSAWNNLLKSQVGKSWTKDNTDAYFPRLSDSGGRNRQVQTRYLQDGRFIRLRNLFLSYTFPKKMVKKIGLSDMALTFRGSRLFTIHNLPEPFDAAIGGGSFREPLRREYALGLRVSF